jgi:DNA modification methylase
MFSFVGDTVLDPFVGTGTAMIAAAKAGRNSIGIEIDPTYWRQARERFNRTLPSIVARRTVEFLQWLD